LPPLDWLREPWRSLVVVVVTVVAVLVVVAPASMEAPSVAADLVVAFTRAVLAGDLLAASGRASI
jgi:hypothetical protein